MRSPSPAIWPTRLTYGESGHINHNHALRCGLYCIFKLDTQKIALIHYITYWAKRLQAARCPPMSDLSFNILYALSVRGTLWYIKVCIGSPQYNVLRAHKTNPKKGQFRCSGARYHSQAPEFEALGGARELRTYIYTHIRKWQRGRLRAHVQGCARKRESRGREQEHSKKWILTGSGHRPWADIRVARGCNSRRRASSNIHICSCMPVSLSAGVSVYRCKYIYICLMTYCLSLYLSVCLPTFIGIW